MRNIRLTIEYDGTDFRGWQQQIPEHRTVQDEIEKALKIIFRTKTKVIGSGRTDSGVHARGQVANFKTANRRLKPADIQRALNANLPEDITILEVKEAPKDFHAQYSAKRKTYSYTVLNGPARPAIDRAFCHYHPYRLNVASMRKAASELKGKKDFRAFMAANPALRATEKDKDTVRTMSRLDIKKQGDLVRITVTANGFLYKMVRNIVGTLLAVGSGQLAPRDIKMILAHKDRQRAGKTAPARGLCLENVEYGKARNRQ